MNIIAWILIGIGAAIILLTGMAMGHEPPETSKRAVQAALVPLILGIVLLFLSNWK